MDNLNVDKKDIPKISTKGIDIKYKPFWYWFLGFIEGEGSFIIHVTNKGLSFRISITKHDAGLLTNLHLKLWEGGIESKIYRRRLDIRKKESIDKITRILIQLDWLSVRKQQSLVSFTKAFDLYYCTHPLTIKTLEKIIDLKLSMNVVTSNKKRLSKERLMEKIKEIARYKND